MPTQRLAARGTVRGVFFSLGTTPSRDPQLDCAKAIIDLYKAAQKTVHVAICTRTDRRLVDAVGAARLTAREDAMAAVKRGARRKETGLKLGYGWIPDLPDHRDILYGAVHRVPVRLPSSVDLRRGCLPVEDQGDLGSCTANALAGAVEFLEKKDRIPPVNVSRLFIYYDERVIEHTVSEDAGAMLRDGIKTLVKQGVCSEKKWPYVISKFTVKPSPACYKEAADHQVTAYARLQTVNEMRACLADGYPFVFGFTVYETFESDRVAKTGVVPMPKLREKV